jgi:hypothetical protein
VEGTAAVSDPSAQQQVTGLAVIPQATDVRDARKWLERVIDWIRVRRPPGPGVQPGPTVKPEPGRIGICCSGGGIRSAAYNLGALQSLQEHGLLARARYLAAVSGGSYIAGSLATVASYSSGSDIKAGPVYGPGSPEERHLRNNSSYLAPGWISGKIRLLLRMTQGMIINLAFLGSVIYIVAALYGWLISSRSIYPQLRLPNHQGTINFGLDMWLWVLIPAGVWVLLAIPDLIFRIQDRSSGWLEAWSARMLGVALFALVAVIAVPAALIALRGHATATTLQGAAHAVGVIKHGTPDTQTCSHPSKVAMTGNCTASATGLLQLLTATGLAVSALGAVRAFFARKKSWLALFAGAVAGPLLVVSAFLWVANEASANGPYGRQLFFLGGAIVIVLLVGLIGDLTQWSLHPFYRRRLSEAFFVRRRRKSGVLRAQPLAYRQPYKLSDLKPGGGGPMSVRSDDQRVPELLICAAANISDEGATPPGRNAIPFVFSAAELGGPLVGSMGTSEYERLIDDHSRDITLPAAVAMSGAALAPTMGKKSIRALTFLLALTNLRLGVWVPNPRWAGLLNARWNGRIFPPPWYLFHELLGTHKLNHKYLYITDGGHYENLGLVELLRRGCTMIYCFDASGDRPDTFSTLGEAIALARSDVEVDIDIDPSQLRPTNDGPPAKDHVIGKFRYRTTGDEGTLVFCKTTVTADAPWDVRAFAERDKLFPNDSIFDQLFNDEKFEAYRALGASTAEMALESLNQQVLERKTRDVLVGVARGSTTISYQELTKRVCADVPHNGTKLDLHPVLARITQSEESNGHPPLTVLVEEEVELSGGELWEHAKQLSLRKLPMQGTLKRRRRLVWEHWQP